MNLKNSKRRKRDFPNLVDNRDHLLFRVCAAGHRNSSHLLLLYQLYSPRPLPSPRSARRYCTTSVPCVPFCPGLFTSRLCFSSLSNPHSWPKHLHKSLRTPRLQPCGCGEDPVSSQPNIEKCKNRKTLLTLFLRPSLFICC